MSHASAARTSYHSDEEYFTDWRVVWAICGLVPLIIATAMLVRHRAPRQTISTQRLVENLERQSVAQPVTDSTANDESLRSPNTAATAIVTPWAASESNGSVPKEQRSDVQESQTSNTQKPQPQSAKRIDKQSTKKKDLVAFGMVEDLLRNDVNDHSVEVSIEKDIREKLLRYARTRLSAPATHEGKSGEALLFELVSKQRELAGLPMSRGDDCRKDALNVRWIQKISEALRGSESLLRSPRTPNGSDNDPEQQLTFEMKCAASARLPDWHRAEAVSSLVQILQVGSYTLRLELVSALAAIDGEAANSALVNRAIFDLSPDVRAAAQNALKSRELGEDERRVMLRALRYPWAPVAEHAASLIVALQLGDILPRLNGLLDQPAPDAPFVDEDGQWRRTELVRVNHLRNCLLCHEVSISTKDAVRGLVPKEGEPLPTSYSTARSGDFVRAEVTYLRQDFSVMHWVKKAGPWPSEQRFDYFLRTRKLDPDEVPSVSSQESAAEKSSATYPQREAILRAVRELSAG